MALEGQTIVQFGEVYLYRCVTKQFQQLPIMDPAGVGLKNWRYTVSVVGYLSAIPGGTCKYSEVITSPSLSAATEASTIDKRMRWRLAPRQQFQMAVGCTDTTIASGTVLLSANPMTSVTSTSQLTAAGLSNYDVDDGPRCTQFAISHIAGDAVFRVEATFEINMLHCNDAGGAASNVTGVIAHRWGCTDSLNANLQTVRTYRGFLQIATSQFSPHWFRYLVVPPLAPGMRREHMEFTAAEDGKTLQYSIVDASIDVSAPPPARTWNVEHTEATLSGDVLKSTGQVSVMLTAAKGVDKAELISLGLHVITAKLLGKRPDGTAPDGARNFGPAYMNDITITDWTGDHNMVRVSASCWRQAQTIDGLAGLAVFAEGLATKITTEYLPDFVVDTYGGYDSERSAGGYDGDAPIFEGPVPLAGIFRCYLQSPCSGITGTNNSGGNLAGSAAGSSETALLPPGTVSVVPSIDTTAPVYYSTSQETAPYTYYGVESRYRDRSMRIALPIAGADPTSLDDQTAIVRVAGGQSRREVYIQAERVGQQPELPDAESLDDGYATAIGGVAQVGMALLKSKLLSQTTTRSANGEKLYRCRWAATYALSRTPGKYEQRLVGKNKWATDGTETTDYNSSGAYTY